MMNFDTEGNLRTPNLDSNLHGDATLGRTNLYTNGDFEQGTDFNFWSGLSISEDGPQSGRYYAVQDVYAGWQSSQMVPVDTTNEYQISFWGKTISLGTNDSLSRGYVGFACYDKNQSFIDLRNCGGLGNTVLSRELRPGDEYAYFESNSGWYSGRFEETTSARGYQRQIIFFPPDHPDYSEPWYYSRLNNIAYQEMLQTPEGDWKVRLSSYTGSATGVDAPTTMPDYGYLLPAGTPVSRGHAGGTYNYAFGTPTLPLNTWANHIRTIPANVEVRNSDTRFRQGTKFIRFLILGNYYQRSSTYTVKPTFGLDNIALVNVTQAQTNTYKTPLELSEEGVHVQDFVELGAAPVENVASYIDNGTLYVANEIIEE